MNLPGTAEALNNAEKTVENCTTISIFFIASKVTFCSLSCQFFMKVTMRGKISLVEVMTKQRKTMRKKCPQQTL